MIVAKQLLVILLYIFGFHIYLIVDRTACQCIFAMQSSLGRATILSSSTAFYM